MALNSALSHTLTEDRAAAWGDGEFHVRQLSGPLSLSLSPLLTGFGLALHFRLRPLWGKTVQRLTRMCRRSIHLGLSAAPPSVTRITGGGGWLGPHQLPESSCRKRDERVR